MFTGTYPSKHGAHAEHKRLDRELTTLAEAFAEAGYETVCATNNVWVTRAFGLDRGFDMVYKPWQYVQTDTDFGEIGMRESEFAKYRAAIRTMLDGDLIANAANALYGQFLYRRTDYGADRTNALIRRWLRALGCRSLLPVRQLSGTTHRVPASRALRPPTPPRGC